MHPVTEELLERFKIRKSKKQKVEFRAWLTEKLEAAGYTVNVETCGSSHNVVVGNAMSARLIYTAHYDTCAVLPIPNFITPQNLLLYILYQLAVTVLMLLPTVVLAAVTLLLTDSLLVYMAVVYVTLFGTIYLMLAGKANKNNYNDNTSGVATLLELALTLPEERRNSLCLVFFDNEEKGLLGSAGFKKIHKQTLEKTEPTLINFDCVSDGDHILLVPTKGLRKDSGRMDAITAGFRSRADKQVLPAQKGCIYPSDQVHFKYGLGVAAFRKSKHIGYWLGRIHTARDTVFDRNNIALLRDAAAELLTEIQRNEYAG